MAEELPEIIFIRDLPKKAIRQRALLHKYLAYSFVYMAKSNKLSGHIGLYRQYMRYAADHLAHAKRLISIMVGL
jgi:hypothetical protein